MTHMQKIASKKYILDELVKAGQYASLAKLIKPVSKGLSTFFEGAAKAPSATKYFSEYGTDLTNVNKGWATTRGMDKTVKGFGNNWLAGGIGDSAKIIRGFQEGFGSGGSGALIKGIGGAAKVLGEQVRASQYKIVDLGTNKTKNTAIGLLKQNLVKGKDGKMILKGKAGFGDRVQVGVDQAGNPLFKKRVLMRGISALATPVGFGLMTGVLNQSPADGVKETGMWALARPVAEIKFAKDMVAPLFKKEKSKLEEF